MTTSAGRRLRAAELRARTREQRLVPVNRRLEAFAANFRPAHEAITWKPVDPQTLWTTEEERWEAHVRKIHQARDAAIEDVGTAGWLALKVEARRRRNERLRFERLSRLPKV